MSKTLRRVFVFLPCAPGLTLLLAGAVLAAFTHDPRDTGRAWELLTAGGIVVAMGLVIGVFVSWRINHPKSDEGEETDEDQPPTE